jgi:hypothetical protein
VSEGAIAVGVAKTLGIVVKYRHLLWLLIVGFKGTFMCRETKNYRYEKVSDHLYAGNSVNNFLYRRARHGSG